MKSLFKFIRHSHAAAAVALAGALALCSPQTLRAADETVSPQIESAIDRGLETLARSQKSDGSWSESGASVAITGLATMAFMARGHVPGQGPYGEQINRAVDFILSAQQPGGLLSEGLSQPMYDHGICTIALCEAYGMLDERRQERARTAISRSVRLILDAQRMSKGAGAQGGWRYTPTSTDSDTSVSGWQLMALRGAKNIGAFLPAGAIDAGIAYMVRQAGNDGGFGYQSAGGRANAALTGTGVLSLILLGKPDEPAVKRGGDFLLRTPISRTEHYYYAIYYCSQAAWQLGGQYWATIGRQISSDLLAKQHPDGSWGEGSSGVETGQPYGTAMAVLALSVPYRYLPIYQR